MLRAGRGRGTGRLSTVARTSFMSWRLAPSTASPTGIPWASVNRLRLTPCLPRSVGLVPVFPRPRGTWSWRHPGSANSSPDPSVRHSIPVPPAIIPGIPRRQPIPESTGGRWSRSKCPWHPTPSTGSRCAARSRCGWRKSGLVREAGRRPREGCSPAGEATEPTPPTTRRISERNW